MFREVCRLCSKKDNLIWLFNEQMGNNMPEIIEITSGVRIQKTDSVSQKVCSTCCEVALKMYNFRTRSVKNDEDLKAQCAGYNIRKLTTSAASLSEKIPSLLPITKNKLKDDLKHSPLPLTSKNDIDSKPKVMHPSVKKLVKTYPRIKIPDRCLKRHVSPYVSLQSGEVDEWFKNKGITDTEIARLKKESSERKEERKSILFSPRSLANLVNNVSNNIINKIGDVRIVRKQSETKNDYNFHESHQSSDKLDETSKKRRKSCSSDDETHTHTRIDPDLGTTSSTYGTPTRLQSDDLASSDESDGENSFSTRPLVIPSTTYMCEVCDKNQTSLEDLKIHMRNAHELGIEQQTPTSEESSREIIITTGINRKLLSSDEETSDSDYIRRRSKSSRRPRVIDSDSEDDSSNTTHKECPFCHKIFTTLALRNDHVNTSCVINDSPVKLKEARLSLVRVDEVEDIRRRYSSAFEEEEKEESSDENGKCLLPPEVKDSDESLLAKVLTKTPFTLKVLDGVIDISDDDGEDTPKSKKFRVVHNELLKEDFSLLTDVDWKYLIKRVSGNVPTNDSIIINQQSPKERIFKNLRQYLDRYNIPIEVSHGQFLSVQYKSTTKPPECKCTNIWSNMTPIDLKPVTTQQQAQPLRGVVAPQPRLISPKITEAQGLHKLPQQVPMFNNRRNVSATTFMPITNQVSTHQELTMINTQQTSTSVTAIGQIPHQNAIIHNHVIPQQIQYQLNGLRPPPSYSEYMSNMISRTPATPVVLSSTHNLGSETNRANIISCYTFVMPHTLQDMSNNQQFVGTTTTPTVPVTAPITQPLIRVRDLKDLS